MSIAIGLFPQSSLAQNPAQVGTWSSAVPLPVVSVHAALLPGGRILMSDGQSLGNSAIDWDPVTGDTQQVPAPADIFCNGMEQMADGRLLVVGGTQGADTGITSANIFDPSNESWTPVADMAFQRWYPTATMLPDGRIIVTSGETDCSECDETIQEIYNSSTNTWTQLTGAPFFFPYYPHLFVLSSGKILVASDGEAPIVSQMLDLNAMTWTPVGGAAVDGGSSVMYLPDKFLKLGTSVNPDLTIRNSVATAHLLDMTQASPAWVQVPSMSFPRTYQNATLLPDGTVLVTGGGPTTDAVGVTDAILPAELWSPETNSWTTLASMSVPRLYHSIALLLPDGRVLVSGGGRFNGVNEPTDQLSAQFFSPPYLFKGTRPAITSAPSVITYGQNFRVQTPDAARIAKVSLIRFGSVTHAFNTGQRFVPLSFSAGSSSLTIAAPANANLAPPGNYMLFLVDTNGVPSTAATVQFGPSQPLQTFAPVDFNGDGKEDIIWRNTQTGDTWIWLMNGTSVAAAQRIAIVDPSWKIVGVGNFDGQGRRDIVWHNASLGRVAIWTMNGFTETGSYELQAPVGAPGEWAVVGIADFDRTGLSDILWRDTKTGALYMWKSVSPFAPFGFVSIGIGTADPSWKVVGTADVEGSGLPDIIWHNSVTGGVYIWQLRNDQVSNAIPMGNFSLNWQIGGFGDFSGNGNQDILWRNKATGDVCVWLMNGFSVASQWFPGAPSLAWNVVGTPDLNGDGRSDILWLNSSTGLVTAWLGTPTYLAQPPPFASVGPRWSVAPSQ